VFVLRTHAENIYAYAIVIEKGGRFLWSIAVRPRRQGFGTTLLKEIEAFYRKAGRQGISLTCNTHNPAQKLYFDLGYRVERVLPRYYGEDNGLFMRRIL
jgi:ribosomal protein S18 acetylase RimI-like enzyme